MAADTTVPRTRRALLGAGLGAAIAAVASVVARPLETQAHDSDDVQLGDTNTTTTTTRIDYAGSATAFRTATTDGIGVHGDSLNNFGVAGSSGTGTGVDATSVSGRAVHANSTSNHAVYAESGGGYAVYGLSSGAIAIAAEVDNTEDGSLGLYGISGAKNGAGVVGDGVGQGVPRGVVGRSDHSGTGVVGVCIDSLVWANVPAVAGVGVYGYSSHDGESIGVRGESSTGTAIHAKSSSLKTAKALRATGRVVLDQCAGVAIVAKGTSSVTVTPGIDVVPTSAVVATLQGDAGGATTVKRVAVNPSADTFTIFLTASATRTVKVAWHIFG